MSIYRNITWYLKGLKEYTKNGFEEASKSFNPNDLNENLSEKVCMVTGSNSGIGYSCALQLAKLGATIHLVCRDQKRGEDALNKLKSCNENNNFFLHLLDLSNLGAVYKFAMEFSSTHHKLDILINNAGFMVNELIRTPDNLESSFATNTLGTYVLTETLIEALSRSSDPRVIMVSSGGMLLQKLETTDVNFEKRPSKSFDGTMVYAQNKRQQVIMTTEWALKYPNIKFFSMHPGWADTAGVMSAMPSFYEKHKSKLRTADQGADTAVWLAASKSALNNSNGEFFQDRKVVPQHLWLACTRSSNNEVKTFMEILQGYLKQFCTQ